MVVPLGWRRIQQHYCDGWYQVQKWPEWYLNFNPAVKMNQASWTLTTRTHQLTQKDSIPTYDLFCRRWWNLATRLQKKGMNWSWIQCEHNRKLFAHKKSKQYWLIYIEIFSNISIADHANHSVRINKDNRDNRRQNPFGFAQLNRKKLLRVQCTERPSVCFDCMHARKGSILYRPL